MSHGAMPGLSEEEAVEAESRASRISRHRLDALASDLIDEYLADPASASPPPADPPVLVEAAEPAPPTGECYLVHTSYIRRGKADGTSSVGQYPDEQAAVDSALGYLVSIMGEKEVRRMARARHLILRVKHVPLELLDGMAASIRAHRAGANEEKLGGE